MLRNFGPRIPLTKHCWVHILERETGRGSRARTRQLGSEAADHQGVLGTPQVVPLGFLSLRGTSSLHLASPALLTRVLALAAGAGGHTLFAQSGASSAGSCFTEGSAKEALERHMALVQHAT